jgi:hypothetical protein
MKLADRDRSRDPTNLEQMKAYMMEHEFTEDAEFEADAFQSAKLDEATLQAGFQYIRDQAMAALAEYKRRLAKEKGDDTCGALVVWNVLFHQRIE